MASIHAKDERTPVKDTKKARSRNSGSKTVDKIVELDTLRSFTIPKTRKSNTELLERVLEGSVEYQHEITWVLERSCKDRESLNRISFPDAYLVRNSQLLEEFVEKKKQMRQDHSDKELQDSYAFLYVKLEKDMKKICSEGVRVGNSTLSCIGNPKMGVLLCKHADVIHPAVFRPGQSGYIIIFKIIKGKVKYMVENRGGEPLDPAPGFDCHMSKSVAIDLQSVMAQEAYESTQIYLYEYDDDMEPIERPRHICPHAVVSFKFMGHTKVPARRKGSTHSTVPKGTSTRSSVPDRYAAPSQAKHSSQPKHSSRVQPNPVVSSSGVQASTPILPASTNGIVVWRGPLCFKTRALCEVELLASTTPDYRLFQFGPVLNLDKRVPHAMLTEHYHLDKVGLLDSNGSQCLVNGVVYSYCQLRPVDRDLYSFGQVAIGMVQWECGSVMELNKDTHLVILSDCSITQGLGLKSVISQSASQALHCLLIASQSSPETQSGSGWSMAGWNYNQSDWPGSMPDTESGTQADSQTSIGSSTDTGEPPNNSLDQRLNLMLTETSNKKDSCMAGACSPLSGHASDEQLSSSSPSLSSSSDNEVSEYSDSLSDNELEIIQLKKTPGAVLQSSLSVGTLTSNKYQLPPTTRKPKQLPVYRPTKLNRARQAQQRAITPEAVEDNDDDTSKTDDESDDDSDDSNLSEDLIDQIVRMNPLKSGANSLNNPGSLLISTLLDSIPSNRLKSVNSAPDELSPVPRPLSESSSDVVMNTVVRSTKTGASKMSVSGSAEGVPTADPCDEVAVSRSLVTSSSRTVADVDASEEAMLSIVKMEKRSSRTVNPLMIDVPAIKQVTAIKTETVSPDAASSSSQSPLNFESILKSVIGGPVVRGQQTDSERMLPMSVMPTTSLGFTSETVKPIKMSPSQRNSSSCVTDEVLLTGSGDWVSEIINFQRPVSISSEGERETERPATVSIETTSELSCVRDQSCNVQVEDQSSNEEEAIVGQCVSSILHHCDKDVAIWTNAAGDGEANDVDQECMVHIGLHYLPLLSGQTDEDLREIRSSACTDSNWAKVVSAASLKHHPGFIVKDKQLFYSVYNEHSRPSEALAALSQHNFESLSVAPIFSHIDTISMPEWHLPQNDEEICRSVVSSLPSVVYDSPFSPSSQTVHREGVSCLRGVCSAARISRWPDALLVVDVPPELPRYQANKESSLPQLISIQYDAVRDPRTSVARLPTSIYVKPLRPSGVANNGEKVSGVNLDEEPKNLSVRIHQQRKPKPSSSVSERNPIHNTSVVEKPVVGGELTAATDCNLKESRLQLNVTGSVVLKLEAAHLLPASSNSSPATCPAEDAHLDQDDASHLSEQLIYPSQTKSVKEERPKHLAGISPDVLKRRLEKIEAKLFAIRCKTAANGSSVVQKDATEGSHQTDSETFDTELKNLVVSCIASEDDWQTTRSRPPENLNTIEEAIVNIPPAVDASSSKTSSSAEGSKMIGVSSTMLPDTTTALVRSLTEGSCKESQVVSPNELVCKSNSNNLEVEERRREMQPSIVVFNKTTICAESPDSTIGEMDETSLASKRSVSPATKASQTPAAQGSSLVAGNDPGAKDLGVRKIEGSQRVDVGGLLEKGHLEVSKFSTETRGSPLESQQKRRDSNCESQPLKPLPQIASSRIVDNKGASIVVESAITTDVEKKISHESSDPKDTISNKNVSRNSDNAIPCSKNVDQLSGKASEDDDKIARLPSKPENQIEGSFLDAFCGLSESLLMIRKSVCSSEKVSDVVKKSVDAPVGVHHKIHATGIESFDVIRDHSSLEKNNTAIEEISGSVKKILEKSLTKINALSDKLEREPSTDRYHSTQKSKTGSLLEKEIDDRKNKDSTEKDVTSKRKKKSKKSHKKSHEERKLKKKKRRHSGDYDDEAVKMNTEGERRHLNKTQTHDESCPKAEVSQKEASDAVLQCFVSGDVDLKALWRIPEIADNVRNFDCRNVTRQTSFFWAIALAVLEKFVDKQQDSDPEEVDMKPGSKTNSGLGTADHLARGENAEGDVFSGFRSLVKSAKTEVTVTAAVNMIHRQLESVIKEYGLSVTTSSSRSNEMIIFYRSRLHHLKRLLFAADDSGETIDTLGFGESQRTTNFDKKPTPKLDLHEPTQRRNVSESYPSSKSSKHQEITEIVKTGNKESTSARARASVCEDVNSAVFNDKEDGRKRKQTSDDLPADCKQHAAAGERPPISRDSSHIYSQIKQKDGEESRKIKDLKITSQPKSRSSDAKSAHTQEINAYRDKEEKSRSHETKRNEEKTACDSKPSKRSHSNNDSVVKTTISDKESSKYGLKDATQKTEQIMSSKKSRYSSPSESDVRKVERISSKNGSCELSSRCVENKELSGSKKSESEFSERKEENNLDRYLSNASKVVTSKSSITSSESRSSNAKNEIKEKDAVYHNPSPHKYKSSQGSLPEALSRSVDDETQYRSKKKEHTRSDSVERKDPKEFVDSVERKKKLADSVERKGHKESTEKVERKGHKELAEIVERKVHNESTEKVERKGHKDSAESVERKGHKELAESVERKVHKESTEKVERKGHKESTESVERKSHKDSAENVERKGHKESRQRCETSHSPVTGSTGNETAVDSCKSDREELTSGKKIAKKDFSLASLDTLQESRSLPCRGKVKMGRSDDSDERQLKRVSDDSEDLTKSECKKPRLSEKPACEEQVKKVHSRSKLCDEKSRSSMVEGDGLGGEDVKPVLCCDEIDGVGLKLCHSEAEDGSASVETSITAVASLASNSDALSASAGTQNSLDKVVIDDIDNTELKSLTPDEEIPAVTESITDEPSAEPNDALKSSPSADRMRFMQVFRRSQITKRRNQRLSQQTATGGKLLQSAVLRPSTATLGIKQKPLGLTLQETLAALSSSKGKSESPATCSQPETSTTTNNIPLPDSSASTSDSASSANHVVAKLDTKTSEKDSQMISSAIDVPLPGIGEVLEGSIPSVSGTSLDSAVTSLPGTGEVIKGSIPSVSGISLGSAVTSYGYSYWFNSSTDSSMMATYPGSDQPMMATYPGSDQPMMATYPGSDQPMMATYPGSDQPMVPSYEHTGWIQSHTFDYSQYWNPYHDLAVSQPASQVSQINQGSPLIFADGIPDAPVQKMSTDVLPQWEMPLMPPPIPPAALVSPVTVPQPSVIPALLPVIPSSVPASVIPPLMPGNAPPLKSPVRPPLLATPSINTFTPPGKVPPRLPLSSAPNKSPGSSAIVPFVKAALHDTSQRLQNPLPPPPKLPPKRAAVPLMMSLSPRKLSELSNRMLVPEDLPKATANGQRRFYVFRYGQAICEAAKSFLLSSMQLFDPFNVNLLRHVPCLVFIQAADVRAVHRLPGLLRLKRNVNVNFVVFQSMDDLHRRTVTPVLARAGLVVMHTETLLASKPELLDIMLNFMLRQTNERNTPWKLMLSPALISQLEALRVGANQSHSKLAAMIKHFQSLNVIDVLANERGRMANVEYYQQSCISLQTTQLRHFRHFLFVIDVRRQPRVVEKFVTNGIDIMNVRDFVQAFVGVKSDEHPLLPLSVIIDESTLYEDVTLSNAAEDISAKIG